MCRHIGYIGKEKLLSEVLIKKKYSLLEQAYSPKEMKNAALNADGFGIGWYNNKKLFSYKSNLPIWNDPNLTAITNNIKSKLIFGNVRSATLTSDVGHHNTHPFEWKNFLFSHNGYIEDFENSTKEKIIKFLDSKILSQIKGNTDSEYIFFLLIHFYLKEKNIFKIIERTMNFLSKTCNAAMLNFLIAFYDKKNSCKLYATKGAINLPPPSLYYQINKKNSFYISSEKLDDNRWTKIKDFSLIECDNKKISIIPL